MFYTDAEDITDGFLTTGLLPAGVSCFLEDIPASVPASYSTARTL
ncbi:hypothetical protein AVEN_150713-1, partial [Araneus ventricosus]